MQSLNKRNVKFKKFFLVVALFFSLLSPLFARGSKTAEKNEQKLMGLGSFFNNNASENFIAQAIIETVDEFMDLSTKILSFDFVNVSAKQIFYLMMVLFFIFSCMYFIFSQNLLANNPNWSEGFQIGVKMLVGFAIFAVAPFLPNILIKFSWWTAEMIMGAESGTMSYTLPLTSFGWSNFGVGVATGTTLGAGSIIDISILGNKAVSGGGLGSLSSLSFAFAVAGIGATLTATLMYCINCLELYFATIVLIMYIPSTLFNGFNSKSMSYFKYLWTNFLEMFLMNIMILLVCKLSEMGFPSNNFISSLIGNVLKPTILLILLPASSKIINSLVNGGGSADTTDGVRQGIRGITGGAAKASVLGASAKGGLGKLANKRQDKKAQNDAWNTISQKYGGKKFNELSKKEQQSIKSLMGGDNMAQKMASDIKADEVRNQLLKIRGGDTAKANASAKEASGEKGASA